MSKKDYYEVLGVSRDADEATIKKTFRNLAKKYHPDVNSGDKESEQKFKEVNEAAEVLLDSEKRAKYDRFGHAGVDPNSYGGQGGGFTDFGDLFGDLFGGFGFNTGQRNGPRRGESISARVIITLEEAYKGVSKLIEYQRIEVCNTCSGSGSKDSSSISTCDQCNGSGQVKFVRGNGFFQSVSVKDCDKCNGSGKVIKDKCDTCKGKAKVRKNHKESVNIPAGVDTGNTLRVSSGGNAGSKGGGYGDLLVEIIVKEHEIFDRQDDNLICEVPISFDQAVLGDTVTIPTLEKEVDITIPEGTQHGTKFRLRGLGMPSVNGYRKGDLYAQVTIEIPKKLNNMQKDLLRKFASSLSSDSHEKKESFLNKIKKFVGKE